MSRLLKYSPGVVATGCVWLGLSWGLFNVIKYAFTDVDGLILDDPWLQQVLLFSIKQAGLSALFSVGGAVLFALAIARRVFWGRQWLMALLQVCFALPVIVVILGIVQVYGRSGWLNHLLGTEFSIYGLAGILICHVFFNLPLATRVLVSHLEAIPDSYYAQAAQMQLNGWWRWRWLEWPLIRTQVVGLSLLVFLLCFNSFTIVLALGGGPKSTTLEVAIYQALRYEFDLPQAGILALLQLALAIIIAVLATRLMPASTTTAPISVHRSQQALWLSASKLWVTIRGFGLIFCLLPLLAIVWGAWSGLSAWPWSSSLGEATLNSLLIGLCSSLLACLLSLAMLHFRQHMRYRCVDRWLEQTAVAALYLPPVVLATGWFIGTLAWHRADYWSYILIVMANALMALPFTFRLIASAFQHCYDYYGPLAQSLGLRRWAWWRWFVLPMTNKPLAQSLALAWILSLGDMGVAVLVGAADFNTLPLTIYRLLGSYQLASAMAVAVWLLVCCGLCYGLVYLTLGRKSASS
ncbi:ABC transporter permease subunit [Zooshikella harenae]|uniref:ABC transporter permease subunit n=1 Tax=Zooshikella harenae TaxID=2827238 RepID=A0ABS5Z8Q0_9GAMM|nr:ABC transporter permease subunit [Zooshikella harenae]MBU2710411.1 ABC transporter permease subunit [Zooshikella harenae]